MDADETLMTKCRIARVILSEAKDLVCSTLNGGDFQGDRSKILRLTSE
jgi:hypothetical protein